MCMKPCEFVHQNKRGQNVSIYLKKKKTMDLSSQYCKSCSSILDEHLFQRLQVNVWAIPNKYTSKRQHSCFSIYFFHISILLKDNTKIIHAFFVWMVGAVDWKSNWVRKSSTFHPLKYHLKSFNKLSNNTEVSMNLYLWVHQTKNSTSNIVSKYYCKVWLDLWQYINIFPHCFFLQCTE